MSKILFYVVLIIVFCISFIKGFYYGNAFECKLNENQINYIEDKRY